MHGLFTWLGFAHAKPTTMKGGCQDVTVYSLGANEPKCYILVSRYNGYDSLFSCCCFFVENELWDKV